MARKKKINHNTNENSESKNESWNEYLSTLSFQMVPYNDGYIQRLAIELVTWARENTKAFMVSQFYNMKGINEATYYRWVEKYPALKDANEVALSIIADRRENYLIERDPSSVRYIMPQYSKIYLKEDERKFKQKAQLKEKEENGLTKFIVVEDHMWCKNKDDCDRHQNHNTKDKEQYVHQRIQAINETK